VNTKEQMMKTILLTAAAIGLSVSFAAADCVGHKQVNASVDTETKVASVVKQVPPPVEEAQSTASAEQTAPQAE
jgi:hypothetical protein